MSISSSPEVPGAIPVCKSLLTVLGDCHILSHIWFYQMDVVKRFELLMSLGLRGAITMKKAFKLCYDFIQTRKNRENKIFKAFIAYSQSSLINLFFSGS